jgi:hypothetical protein
MCDRASIVAGNETKAPDPFIEGYGCDFCGQLFLWRRVLSECTVPSTHYLSIFSLYPTCSWMARPYSPLQDIERTWYHTDRWTNNDDLSTYRTR